MEKETVMTGSRAHRGEDGEGKGGGGKCGGDGVETEANF